ncbi:MAG: glutamyl-tRNA reductase [Armatimonadota bacterium]
MTITLIGVNHETAGVQTRERLAVSAHNLLSSLTQAASCPGVAECFILSTCNRSELYLVSHNGDLPSPEAVYARALGVSPELFEHHSYILHDSEAVAHVFKVASGADSMVLGETEIMGQLRRAVERARGAGMAGRILSRLGDKALCVGKRVRTETKIDKGCTSVASVAADLARRIFADLSARQILVLGAGETGALAARRMMDHGARDLTVTSRAFERAEALANDISARAVAFEAFDDELRLADIVITSTSSPHPLVTYAQVQAATSASRQRPMLLLDLAMPRDIEPQVRDLGGVYLYNLDDLQQCAKETADQRLCEYPFVEQVAEDEARAFMVWANSQQVVPLMLDIRRQAEAVREEEVRLLMEAVPELSRKADKAMHLMTKRLVRRLLDQPLEKLRELSSEGLSESERAVIAEMLSGRDEEEQTEKGA